MALTWSALCKEQQTNECQIKAIKACKPTPSSSVRQEQMLLEAAMLQPYTNNTERVSNKTEKNSMQANAMKTLLWGKTNNKYNLYSPVVWMRTVFKRKAQKGAEQTI